MDSNWHFRCRKAGTINVPMSLFKQMIDPHLTKYALTYLKLRCLRQNYYGSFNLQKDLKKIARLIGTTETVLRNHITRLIQIGWIKKKTNIHGEEHTHNCHIVSFRDEHTFQCVRLSTEHIFSVSNSDNKSLTRLKFTEHGCIGVVNINKDDTITLQQFRVFLSELFNEFDKTLKIKNVKKHNTQSIRKSNKKASSTSLQMWHIDCIRDAHFVAIRYQAKQTKLGLSTHQKYRKISNEMGFATYLTKKVRNNNPIIDKLFKSGCALQPLNDVIFNKQYQTPFNTDLCLQQTEIVARVNTCKEYGRFFVNKKGQLVLNLVAKRISSMEFNSKMIVSLKKKDKSIVNSINLTNSFSNTPIITKLLHKNIDCKVG